MPRGEKSLGNNYGKNNKGKTYNSHHFDINGRGRTTKAIKIAVHCDAHGLPKSMCIWLSNGDVIDSNEPMSNQWTKKFRKWHGVQYDYFRGGEKVFTDIVKTPYDTHDRYIEKELKTYE